MASARFEHLLAGTAVAVALALTPYASNARAASDAEITAAVPMPESADLPPPSIKDLAPSDLAIKSGTPADTVASKPVPAATETTNSLPASDGAKFTTAAAGDTAIVDKLATNWPPESSTASSAARRSARRSKLSTPAATSRRSGSPTAPSANAVRPRLPISRA